MGIKQKRNAKGVFICQGEPAIAPVRSRFQNSLHRAFREAAAAKGLSASEYIRIAVREKLERDCGES